MTGIAYLQAGLALILQVLLLQALLRNAGKRYIFLTLFVISLFLGLVVELSIIVSSTGQWTQTAKQYYWTVDVIEQLLVFCAIISFIYQHMTSGETRSRLSRWLIPAAILTVAASFYAHQDGRINFRMSSVSRDLSFFATLLNLILWGVLLRSKSPNQQLLLVSGGLGIQLAGNAMGQGLRLLRVWSDVLYWMGNIVGSATYLLSLYVLYRAFTRATEPVREQRQAV